MQVSGRTERFEPDSAHNRGVPSATKHHPVGNRSGHRDPNGEGAAERRLSGNARDVLVREEPLVLEVDNDRLVTMRTPGQDLDFAFGFLLSEGVVGSPADVASIDFQKGIPLDEPGPGPHGDGVVADRLRIRLQAGGGVRLDALRRTHEIRASCGVCGVEDLDELMPHGHLTAGRPQIARASLHGLLADLERRQELFRRTGGCHAAMIATVEGQVLGFGEDVGRHNALDKAIGQAARGGSELERAVGVLSGRAGYELIAKLLRVGCPIMVAVSAASALAFDLCREAGATLVGFARQGGMKVYWDEGRIL